MCSSDVKLLRELQVDLTAQHHIAADLLSEVCKWFKCDHQCVLDTVHVVAATISNLQKLEAVMTCREEISHTELRSLHEAVEDHVQRLIRELKPFLSHVLPYSISAAGYTGLAELDVSL